MTRKKMQKRKPGFTLIELMVVIGIIAIVVSIVLPAFSLSKKKAREIVCLANISALGKAWLIYAEMNNDNIVVANPLPESVMCPYYSWVKAPYDPDNCTTAEEITGIKIGALFPYLETVDVYHCASDTRHTSPPMDPFGKGDGGYRSYSIPAGLYGVSYNPNLKKFSIENNYTDIIRKTDVKSPSSKYTFVEEAYGKGMNRDAWNFIPNPADHLDEYADPVALWHGNSSTFCFADGHAESRTWHDAQLIQTTLEQKDGPLADYVSNDDADWLAMGFPYLQYIGP